MKASVLSSIFVTAAVFAACGAAAPASADVFTYQGELRQSGSVVTDLCDFRFTLWDAVSGGVQIGPQVEFLSEAVVDGRITVPLDFGPGAFDGTARWIQIQVRCPAGSGSFVTLSPRQAVTAAPYALKSFGNTMSWMDGIGVVKTSDNVGLNLGNDSAQARLHVKSTDANIPNSFLANDDVIVEDKLGDAVLGLYSENSRLSGLTFGQTFASTSLVKWALVREASSLNFNWGVTSDLTGGTNVMRFRGSGIDPGVIISEPSGNTAQVTFQVGDELYVDALNDFTGIGRTSPVTGAEVFGIYGNTTGFAGMYAETLATGEPFYGYSAGGDVDAYHYYSGSTGRWHLFLNGGIRITVGDSDTGATGGGYLITGVESGVNISMDNNEIQARNNSVGSTLFLNHEGGDVLVGQSSGGTTRLVTPVIQITGGSDFSEMFDVGGEIEVEPGMVVAIDPQHPGRLIASSVAYDRRVAGVVSGAGGVATGMTMGQSGTIADGEHPVALSGRVYCMVDAGEHAVEPGDMLTTSDLPGHAMKAADRDRAHGAVIGKAMTSLAKGERGLVLVLVNLQ